MSWQTFKKFFVYLHPLKLSLDTSKVPFKENFFQSMQSKIVRAFNDMEALEAGNIANPDEKRMVGHYWLRNFQLAPNQNINMVLHDNWLKVRTFTEKIINQEIQGSQGPFKYLLCVGIGGSALGPQLLSDALDRKSKGLRALFIDNTDPDGIFRTLKKIYKHLGQTLVLVTSKSGGTPEPRNGLMEVKAAFARQKIPFNQHAVAITCEGSKLDLMAQEERWLARFPMWDWVGGRTSLFSNVGLVPAALQNIDISALVQGATEMDILTRNTEVLTNPAMMLALSWYACTEGTGKRNMVVLPYKDALVLFPRYLQQLVMESLGKKFANDGRKIYQGLTVYGNKGSTDQHAYVQQLRDGLDDAFVTFIEVQVPHNGSNVQVEYIIYPPSHTALAQASSISYCAERQKSDILFPHAFITSASFLNIPSPLHGASMIILSKNIGNLSAILSGDSLSTTALVKPKSSTFLRRAFVLDVLISFVTSIPSPLSLAPACVLFPPGAAHTSKTRSPGCISATAAVDIAEGS